METSYEFDSRSGHHHIKKIIKMIGGGMKSKFDPRCHIGEKHGIYTIVDVLDEKDKHGHWIYKSVCILRKMVI